MTFSNEDQKEKWSTNNIIEDLHYNLISIRVDGLRKYDHQLGFLLYNMPIYRISQTGNKQHPDFNIDLKKISENVKEYLASFPKGEVVVIVKEAVNRLFENLGTKEKVFFNKHTKHLLKVRFI